MTRPRARLLIVVLTALLLSACAAGANPEGGTGAQQAGFWLGLWHGAISPVSFVVSLFNDRVGMYEVDNSGAWYDFGFIVGVSMVFSGGVRSGYAAGPARERRRSGARG